jgi:DNA-binding MarR family transcriptional regulator
MPLWSRPGYLVRRLHQIHSALWAEECKPFNITPVQYGLMTALLYYPNSDQASLGLEIGIDRTNVADVLGRLAERGLVQRTQGTRDRRTMLARLTPAGEALTKKMHASMQRAQERLLAPLPEGERAQFIAQLTILIDENESSPAATGAAPRLRSPTRSRNG